MLATLAKFIARSSLWVCRIYHCATCRATAHLSRDRGAYNADSGPSTSSPILPAVSGSVSESRAAEICESSVNPLPLGQAAHVRFTPATRIHTAGQRQKSSKTIRRVRGRAVRAGAQAWMNGCCARAPLVVYRVAVRMLHLPWVVHRLRMSRHLVRHSCVRKSQCA